MEIKGFQRSFFFLFYSIADSLGIPPTPEIMFSASTAPSVLHLLQCHRCRRIFLAGIIIKILEFLSHPMYLPLNFPTFWSKFLKSSTVKYFLSFAAEIWQNKARAIIWDQMIALTFFANFTAAKDEKYFSQIFEEVMTSEIWLKNSSRIHFPLMQPHSNSQNYPIHLPQVFYRYSDQNSIIPLSATASLPI